MASFIQPNFGKGEISPALYGRVDSDAYKQGLATARNAIVHGYGAVSNRAGSKFIGPVKDHTVTPRLIPFQFSTVESYILEFGNAYFRVIKNNAYITETAVTITGVTNANPGVVTAASHGYSNGDEVAISGVLGMLAINNRRFIVANVTASTFELTDQVTGANVDTTAWGTYVSGGNVGKIFEVATPYASADLFELKFTQDANILTVTHPDYVVQEITRTSDTAWTITEPAFLPVQDHPVGQTVTVNVAGTETDSYQVTAIAEDGEESLTALNNTSATITNITKADPAVVTTSAAHNYANGDEIEINSVVGMTEVNGRRFYVANVTATTFELQDFEFVDVDSTSYGTYVSGGTANQVFVTVTNSSTSPDNTISWTAITGAIKYAVYKETNGLYGLIGETRETSFNDINITPNTDFVPPRYIEIFFFANDLPGAVGYFQQRRVFGGTNNEPDVMHYSRTGLSDNFTYNIPRSGSDAIEANLTSKQVNEIRHIVPLDDLLVFTSGSEWAIDSGFDSGFSIATLRQREQSVWGSSHRQPLIIGGVVFFVQTNNALVRTLSFDGDKDQWQGENAGLLAEHLLRNNSITDWCLTKFPDPIIYMVRDDGHVLTMTFNLENKVIAWTDWDTDGKYESLASLRTSSDASEETVYTVVKRTVGGNTVRYVEYMASRNFDNVYDCFFVDSGLTFDNPITISNTTAADPVVVTANSHGFAAGDEVDIFDIIWEPNTDEFFNDTQPDQLNGGRFFVADITTNTFSLVKNSDYKQITGITQANPAVVTSVAHGLTNGEKIGIFQVAGMTEVNGKTYTVANVTADTFELSGIDSSAFTAYTSAGRVYPAIDGSAYNAYKEGGTVRETSGKLYGMWHLIGENIEALLDGNVPGTLTVASDGSVTLPYNVSRAHLGLRYVTDIKTLPPELQGTSNNATLLDKDKKVSEVTVRFSQSRGLLIGLENTDFTEMKQREFEKLGEPTQLLTGIKKIPIPSGWTVDGQIIFRQKYPLPLSILAIAYELDVGD